MNKNILKDFYDYMESQKYPINAIFIFVYNDYDTYIDDPHLEECFDNVEVHEILDAVSDIFQETLAFNSEKAFIQWCATQAIQDKKIYVYTMAQYIEGFGRRTLIPALCQYYGFININADAYMSALGCNKETMYKLLAVNNMSDILAPTVFINQYQNIDYKYIRSKLGAHVVLKPINESCCIDIAILENYTESDLYYHTNQLLNKYGHAMLQKYIDGKEIGITVHFHKQEMCTLPPVQIVFPYGKKHLTHIDSFYENYQLVHYNVPQDLLEKCKSMSYALEFFCTTRFDFRYDGEKYYLFDLSPNPTVNGYTSSNYAARSALKSDHRGILRLMAYEKISLFEPSFNWTH
ncbi:MAG: hypothetical protein J6L69_06955 [Lachnospiraceae bacterium]|nr:hypothetical protein [Lachnospiraceae bacterium]